ncbi:MAG: hypothetical protein ABI947_27360 [Chloroflexota bacterium]
MNGLISRKFVLLLAAIILCVFSVVALLITPLADNIALRSETVFMPILFYIYAYSGAWLTIGLALLLVGIWVILFVGILVSKKKTFAKTSQLQGCLIVVMVLIAFIGASLLSLGTIWRNIHQEDQLQFDNNVYRLIGIDTTGFESIYNAYLVLYKCDSSGLICNAQHVMNGKNSLHLGYNNANQLYIASDKDVYYVQDSVKAITPSPIELSAGPAIIVENAVQVKELQQLTRGTIGNAQWSIDGKLLYVVGLIPSRQLGTSGVWIYSIDALEKPPQQIIFDKDPYGDAVFNSDRSLVAVKDYTSTAYVLDVKTGKSLYSFATSDNKIDAIAFSPAASALAYTTSNYTPSNDTSSTVKLYNSVNKTESVLVGYEKSAYEIIDKLVYSPNGKLLAGVSGINLRVWELASFTERHVQGYRGQGAKPIIVFSPNGAILASLDANGYIYLLDAESGKTLKAIHQTGYLNDLIFSADSSLLVSAGENGVIQVWNTKTGDNLITLKGHTNDVNSIAFSPDGKFLASTSKDGTLRFWGMPK